MPKAGVERKRCSLKKKKAWVSSRRTPKSDVHLKESQVKGLTRLKDLLQQISGFVQIIIIYDSFQQNLFTWRMRWWSVKNQIVVVLWGLLVGLGTEYYDSKLSAGGAGSGFVGGAKEQKLSPASTLNLLRFFLNCLKTPVGELVESNTRTSISFIKLTCDGLKWLTHNLPYERN